MTLTQRIITIGMVIFGTMLTRFIPFLVFRPDRPIPNYISTWGMLCREQYSAFWSSIA